jgi:hypothetical protein
MTTALRALVRERAGGACEYCLVRQEHDPFFTFPVDHVIARQHGGRTDADNLCLSCYRCNSRKGPNIAALDPLTGELVPLYSPRGDEWLRHFRWDGAVIAGLTPVGRATVALLAMNHPDAVILRARLVEEGGFSPPGFVQRAATPPTATD